MTQQSHQTAPTPPDALRHAEAHISAIRTSFKKAVCKHYASPGLGISPEPQSERPISANSRRSP